MDENPTNRALTPESERCGSFRAPAKRLSLSRGQLNLRIVLSLTPFTFLYGLSEEIFDLAIHAAQLDLCPCFQLSPELGINTK